MKCERRFTPRKVSASVRDDGEGAPKSIVGYAAVFYREGAEDTEYEMYPGVRERIMPGAFDRALKEQDDTRALFNHNPDNLLARSPGGELRLSVDETGLRYEFDIDENDPDHARVLAKLVRGDLTGSSFAFIPERASWIELEDADIRQVEQVRLFDVGPVTYPAYDGTSAGARDASADESILAERDAWKRTRQILNVPIP